MKASVLLVSFPKCLLITRTVTLGFAGLRSEAFSLGFSIDSVGVLLVWTKKQEAAAATTEEDWEEREEATASPAKQISIDLSALTAETGGSSNHFPSWF